MSSSINGYFAGIRKFKNNILGNYIEQLSKIMATYVLLKFTDLNSIDQICLMLIIGDVFSEVVSFIYLAFEYFSDIKLSSNMFTKNRSFKTLRLYKIKTSSKIFTILIPIALTSYIRSGISTIKQFIIPISFEKSGLNCSQALSDYGIIASMTMPIIMFPAVFLSLLSNLLIPEFSRYNAKHDTYKIKKYSDRLILITFIFSCFISLIMFLFGKKAGILIYNNENCGIYIKIFSLIIPFMYVDIIIDSILKGIDKQIYSMKINIIDSIVSTLLILFIVPILGIKGYIFSIFLGEILNLLLSLRGLTHL